MTAKTMAEVLAEHQPTSKLLSPSDVRTACLCGSYVQDDELPTFHNTWIIAHQSAALSAAGFGLVADAKAEALEEAADDFEGNVGVGEFAELSTRDGNPWGHIEESWEHQGPYMDWLRNRAAALRAVS